MKHMWHNNKHKPRAPRPWPFNISLALRAINTINQKADLPKPCLSSSSTPPKPGLPN